MNDVEKMRLTALAFIALCGFFGLVGVGVAYLEHTWFGLIFGAIIAAIAAVGCSLIVVSARPEKEKEETTKEPGDE